MNGGDFRLRGNEKKQFGMTEINTRRVESGRDALLVENEKEDDDENR